MKQHIRFSVCAILMVSMLPACKKNFSNPNQATSEQVFSSVNGITDVAINLQYLYVRTGGLLYDNVSVSSLLTNQLAVVNAGNTDEQQLYEGGGNVQATNAVITSQWTTALKIISDANDVIRASSGVSDKGYASGLVATASLYKALALGSLAEFWEKVPDTIGRNVGFISSAEGYAKAIAVLTDALSTIAANPVSTGFNTNVPSGVDLFNTLHALRARYELFAGNYTDALADANAIDLAKTSDFNFDAVNLNPVFSSATATNNLYQPADSSFGLPAALRPDQSDKRVAFYIQALPASTTGLGIRGFFADGLQSVPVYLSGEIILIKAECLARQNDADNALTQLNIVVTKQPADDPHGLGAGLPAISGPLSTDDLLTEIYRNRCIELYMSGLTLEDQRRFSRNSAERKRNYLPYPFAERNDNSNTPADPGF